MTKLVVIKEELETLLDTGKTYTKDKVDEFAGLFGINTKKRVYRVDFPSKNILYLGSYVMKRFNFYLEGLISFKESFLFVRNELKKYDNAITTKDIFTQLTIKHNIPSFSYSFLSKEGYLRKDLERLVEQEAVWKISSFHKHYSKTCFVDVSRWQVSSFVKKIQKLGVIGTPKKYPYLGIYVRDADKIIKLLDKEI